MLELCIVIDLTLHEKLISIQWKFLAEFCHKSTPEVTGITTLQRLYMMNRNGSTIACTCRKINSDGSQVFDWIQVGIFRQRHLWFDTIFEFVAGIFRY